MKLKNLVFVLFFLAGSGHILFGQTGSASEGEFTEKGVSFPQEADWSYFVDAENKVYYIDFETINVNLSDIVLKDLEGNELFRESLMELPVNTIYELDMSKFGQGVYSVELHTFTDEVLLRRINVR